MRIKDFKIKTLFEYCYNKQANIKSCENCPLRDNEHGVEVGYCIGETLSKLRIEYLEREAFKR